MDDFLVHETVQNGPATHAIVIGIGAYPHLNGGDGALTTDHDGMGQLSSPPVSAREFATWLIGSFNNPGKPLASVALLLSEPDAAPFRNPVLGADIDVAAATMENVKAAVRDWKARGDVDPDNLVVFYFCGHGIAQGPDISLLLEDYGESDDAPLDGAIDFRRLHLGMARCKASQQVYFIDACRASSDSLIEAYNFAGQVIIQPNVRDQGSPEAPIYYATLAGKKAYGRIGKPSIFTDALLQGLKGAGSDDAEGDWRVHTTGLKAAIDHSLKRAVELGGRRTQVPPTGNLTTFFLHYLDDGPEVPVIVSCRPEEAIATATLSCRLADTERARRDPGPDAWELQLPVGMYEFQAEFAEGGIGPVKREQYVRPPYRKVPLEIVR